MTGRTLGTGRTYSTKGAPLDVLAALDSAWKQAGGDYLHGYDVTPDPSGPVVVWFSGPLGLLVGDVSRGTLVRWHGDPLPVPFEVTEEPDAALTLETMPQTLEGAQQSARFAASALGHQRPTGSGSGWLWMLGGAGALAVAAWVAARRGRR